MEIVDFHTHPFFRDEENVCRYIDSCRMSPDRIEPDLRALGIGHIVGSMIDLTVEPEDVSWELLETMNQSALRMEKKLNGYYTPGCHVHPAYVRESCWEIERWAQSGHRLIGEVVPYMHGWNYDAPGLDEILHVAEEFRMVFSFHSNDDEAMDAMVRKHPNLVMVAAHPGEKTAYARHLERMGLSENYHLDVSGTGILRQGILRVGIDRWGTGRFLYGSDYPICNPAAYIGAIRDDFLLTENEKEAVFHLNAKRLLDL